MAEKSTKPGDDEKALRAYVARMIVRNRDKGFPLSELPLEIDHEGIMLTWTTATGWRTVPSANTRDAAT